MSLNPECDHARKCDKCHLYYCANDQLIMCKSCFGSCFCSQCFCVKNVDPVMYEWFCDKIECMKEARRYKKRCARCKNRCIKHKRIIDGPHGELYLCRRCNWFLNHTGSTRFDFDDD